MGGQLGVLLGVFRSFIIQILQTCPPSRERCTSVVPQVSEGRRRLVVDVEGIELCSNIGRVSLIQTLELREFRTLVCDVLDREKFFVNFLSELLLGLELGVLLLTGFLGLLFS